MSVDLLGPANATNAVTVQPADTRTFGATDTFFKDCTGPGSKDGTKVMAAFLNGALQQVRRAIRGMAVTENNADDDMLLKAIQTARDAYLIDTPTTKTVYGVGADFASLPAALAWVSKYRITQNGSVNFALAAGQFVHTTAFLFDHPNMDRITITGNGTPTPPTSFAYTGNSGAALTADQGSALTALRAAYPTELRLTSGANMVGTKYFTLRNLLVTGDGTITANGGMIFVQGGALLDRVSVHGAGGNGLVAQTSWVKLITYFSATGNAYNGIENIGGGIFLNCRVLGCNNIGSGLHGVGGNILAATADIYKYNGNGYVGVSLDGTHINTDIAGGEIKNNGAGGFGGARMRGTLKGAVITGNTSYGVSVSYGTNVDFTGATSQSYSPALNTVGNNNSYIVG